MHPRKSEIEAHNFLIVTVLILKSGDIIVLERSYGDYLRSIYAEISVGL